jgi:hypothetical protein
VSPEALDLREVNEVLDNLALDGDEMLDILAYAASPMAARWKQNIVTEGLVGDAPFHYRDSLVLNPVFRKSTHATIEIAAAASTEPDDDIFYPAVLEYGSPTIAAHPVAMRAFDTMRRTVVASVAEESGRRVTSRRRKSKKR